MKLEEERDYSETDSGVWGLFKGKSGIKQHLHKVQLPSDCR